MANIYDYLDYRRFLKDRVENLRINGRFSFRNFNRRSGFRSSAALKLVMDGRRNLAQEGIFKVTKGFKLTSTEAKFFTHLVQMTQATTHEEKDFHFRQLAAYRPFRKAKELTALQYDCLSHWYYAAILELVRLHNFQENPEWIVRRLGGNVTLSEVRRALTDLEQLKFLQRNKEGKIERTEQTLVTPDEVRSLSVVNFHRQMCDLAKKAVSEVPSDRREFSSITIALSEEGFSKIKARFQEFKRELDSYLEENQTQKNQVIQINLQVFPLTTKES
ncbi:MAG: TIGR02147 family protein [Deltaproteobacteria bacterium]|nr:TIGR02147 family protein [Deltaproteobacteria bacterium]